MPCQANGDKVVSDRVTGTRSGSLGFNDNSWLGQSTVEEPPAATNRAHHTERPAVALDEFNNWIWIWFTGRRRFRVVGTAVEFHVACTPRESRCMADRNNRGDLT